jgi:hypothetical protein
MVNRQKVKGTAWENDLVKILNSNIRNIKAKRVAGSGALGTMLGESLLMGDVVLEGDFLPKKIRIEAKVGYGGAKQLTVQKEWLDKINEEAKASYSIPMLACKFSGARAKDGVQYFVALDINTFCDIINHIELLNKRLVDGE